MWKKKKIDFMLEEEVDERLIFRFYPRQSSCHSFNENPPTKPEDVYKVYYSYAIIKQFKWDNDSQWESEVFYRESFDECSIIDEVGHTCLLLADGYETFEREDGERIPLLDEELFPFGCGTKWTISKHTCTEYGCFKEDEDVVINYYTFTLFDHWNKGFKFTLKEEKLKAFGEYLLECCDYMLTHGDPI